MARNVDFERSFFTEVLNGEGVARLCDDAATAGLAEARATAPVDTGAYRDGLRKQRIKARDRVGVAIVATDPKSMIVESQTGNLARMARKLNRGR